jgi:hypothetical protein
LQLLGDLLLLMDTVRATRTGLRKVPCNMIM